MLYEQAAKKFRVSGSSKCETEKVQKLNTTTVSQKTYSAAILNSTLERLNMQQAPMMAMLHFWMPKNAL